MLIDNFESRKTKCITMTVRNAIVMDMQKSITQQTEFFMRYPLFPEAKFHAVRQKRCLPIRFDYQQCWEILKHMHISSHMVRGLGSGRHFFKMFIETLIHTSLYQMVFCTARNEINNRQ